MQDSGNPAGSHNQVSSIEFWLFFNLLSATFPTFIYVVGLLIVFPASNWEQFLEVASIQAAGAVLTLAGFAILLNCLGDLIERRWMPNSYTLSFMLFCGFLCSAVIGMGAYGQALITAEQIAGLEGIAWSVPASYLWMKFELAIFSLTLGFIVLARSELAWQK